MNNKLYKLMNWPRIEGVVYSEEDHPHEILGPHMSGRNVLFQTFQPDAAEVTIIVNGGEKKYPMEMADEAGFFAALVPGKLPKEYVYAVKWQDAEEPVMVKDAYQYHSSISEKDIDKFEAGIHYTVYDKLGAHPMTIEGTSGTFFAVWAPNAVRVSVVGNFNRWDGRAHQMVRSAKGGIFELFIPDVKAGDCYQYEIKIRGGMVYLKADPYAFGQQLRPDTASVVRDTVYDWKDQEWLSGRASRQQENAPISIYEMYLGSFRRGEEGEFLNYRQLAPQVVDYVKEMGYTHVELMPIMEHPMDASWGYQTIGYYAPTSRYGTGEDFKYFVDTLHQAGIGVILDWSPAHFPRDNYGLVGFDGTCLYEHMDPRKGVHPHWGTLLYNYGRPQVSNYLIANALYWVEQYHADGIRMEGIASMLYLDYGRKDGEWVANLYGGNENLEAIEMLKHLNSVMKKRNPGVLMIAEEVTAWPKVTGQLEEDGLGFDLKWNTGCVKDFLAYISYDPYFRAHHHNELTFSMIYEYSENFVQSFSHNEVVHGKASMIGKMPGNMEDKFANLRMAYAYMMAHPGKKLLFMGQDIAQFDEFDETKETQWALQQKESHKGVQRLIRDLNKLYREKPALYVLDTRPEGFEWINCISPEQCMVSFLRKSEKERELLVVVANFANLEQEFTIGVPLEGKYKEILNTDAKCYGGQGRINGRARGTEEREVDGRAYSFQMVSAPLSVSIFSYLPYTEKEKQQILQKKAQMKAEREAQQALREAEEARAQAEAAQKEAEEIKEKAQAAVRKAQEAEQAALKQLEKAQAKLKKAKAKAEKMKAEEKKK